MDKTRSTVRRRHFLRATVGTVALAGCLGHSDDEADASDLGEHPALTDSGVVPRLGPDPASAEAVVVEFGDPSCLQCATYADRTFPTLRGDYVDPGRIAYLWRGRPTVAEWAASGIATLHATHEQDPAAFWWLKDRYYDEQGSITTDDTVDRAVEWLGKRDAVDGDAVRIAVDEGQYDERIDTDSRAAAASDVTGVPTFVLFREGEYVTTVVGPQPPEVFEGALDL